MKTTQQFLNYFINANLEVDGIIGRKSSEAIDKAIEKLQGLFAERKWQWDNEFNFIGIRTDDDIDNTFEDWFVLYTYGTIMAFPASTVSGLDGIAKYANRWIRGRQGVGTIAENQQIDYLLVKPQAGNVWSLWTGGKGFLFQDKPITVYRGAIQVNGRWLINKTNPVAGDLGGGFNVHTWRGFWLWLVSNLSEGCQVTREEYWDILFPVLEKNAKNGRIIYSLIKV